MSRIVPIGMMVEFPSGARAVVVRLDELRDIVHVRWIRVPSHLVELGDAFALDRLPTELDGESLRLAQVIEQPGSALV